VAVESFSNEVKADAYNKAWWDLRLKYQGVVPPVARSETDFDPGAKFHVGQRSVHAIFAAEHLAISISARAVPGGRNIWPAAPLLDLRQQRRRQAAERHARAGA
jgi:Angiotensin-converting enzyme